LEILHTYQKQQKDAKEILPGNLSTNPTSSIPTGIANQSILLSETEVYAKVAQLFTNHEDLLAEFSQFLPDATQQPTVNNTSSQTFHFFSETGVLKYSGKNLDPQTMTEILKATRTKYYNRNS
jgi:hypothetical protein